MISSVLSRGLCEGLCCLGGAHGWWINAVDSGTRCPCFWISALEWRSQILHQCLLNWRQFSVNTFFLSGLVPSSSRQGSIDTIYTWNFSNVMSRQMCMGEVVLSHTKSDSAWANSLNSCLHMKLFILFWMENWFGGMWRRIENYREM